MQKENALWKQTLEEMYEICGVPLKMKHSCYLYQQKDVFCINEIIHKRRIMLGMTRKQLCEGICSEKTIARVELTGGKMQMPILREVLGRLGMSGEYQKIDIISSDPTALQLVRDIATHGNTREYEKEKECLAQLEKLISMEEPINRQYIKKTKILLQYDYHEISKAQVLDGLMESLQCTLPLEVIEKRETLYLTKNEQTCLINMAHIQGTEEMNPYYEILWKRCETYETEHTIAQNIGMYEFIMAHVASVLGNMGNYEKSNAISRMIIRENALLRRFGNIADGIYNMAYNYKEQKSEIYDDHIWRKYVSNSAVLFGIFQCYNLQRILEKELQS